MYVPPLATKVGPLVFGANQSFQRLELLLLSLNLPLLLIDLSLLFLKSIYKCDTQTVVLDALDIAFVVVGDKQGIDLCDILRAEADVFHTALFPSERNRTQLLQKR